MAEGKLKPAAENPWYVLATIHGEQDGDEIDWDLAKENRKAWNAWSCQNLSEEACAELAEATGLDQAELRAWPGIEDEVTGKFKDRLGKDTSLPDVAAAVDCRETAFPHTVVWGKAVFTQRAWFASATFTQAAWFASATFTQAARFTGATFTQDAWFDRATFTQAAWFDSATFTQDARFASATFTQAALFDRATFTQRAWFDSATFTQAAWFASATFTRDAWFGSATFEGRAYFIQCRFEGMRQEDGTFKPARAIFRDCEFKRPVTFRETVFADTYPDWTGAILPKNVEFTARDSTTVAVETDTPDGTKTVRTTARYWPVSKNVDPTESKASCAAIRHALNQQGLPEKEHAFFRREMEFAGRIGPIWQRVPYWLFDALSGYGNSLWRPIFLLLCLIAAGLILYAGYFQSPDFEATEETVENPFIAAAGLSISSTVPGFAFGRTYYDRDFLTKLDWPIKFAAGFQAIFGVILLFFLGLGLRTRFRLR